MVKTIQQAVKHHDQYQMEVKLDYELFPSQKTEYQIATYIFVPHHLGIKPATYSKLNFYNDINSYIRLKTPEFNLRQLAESEQSPLYKIEEMVKKIDWVADASKQDQLIIQLKLLGAMLKSAIREHFTLIEKRIAEAQSAPHAKTHHLIHNLVEDFLTETARITARYRELYAPFNLPNLPEEVFTAYTFTDESISILVEENSVEMYQVVSEYLKKTNRSDFMERLYECVENETKYRKTRGYRSILHEEGSNEDYLYRTSVLKKYSSSVLFLDTEVRPEAKNLEQLSFALAAGISMIFATALAFFFQQRFGNMTFPFFISLVIGYMFKDRIKELGRAVFSNHRTFARKKK